MPVYKVTDPETGKTVKLTGDSPPTEQELTEIFSNLPQETSVMEEIIGAGDVALSMGSGIVGDIAGGIVGTGAAILSAPALAGSEQSGVDVGVSIQNAVREGMTIDPKTDVGKRNLEAIAGSDFVQTISQATQGVEQKLADMGFDTNSGPLRTALAVVFPAAIGEVVGAAIPGAITKGAKRISGKAEKTAEGLAAEVEQLRSPEPEAGMQQVAEGLQTGKPEDIGAMVQPDQAFYDAADELNISVEPLASYASQNPQFRAVEQGLSSIPASQLDVQAQAFISELSQKADNLIVEYGGTLDKGALSDKFRSESLGTIENLALKTDELYDTLAMKIPAATKVDATNTVSFIKQKAYELGGRKELPPLLNKVLRQLESTEKVTPSKRIDPITGKPLPGKVTAKQPTHERLNQTRKEVGQALNQKSGPFKDQEIGLLKALYKRLRTDQDAVAGTMGAGDISDAANGMVKQRKHLEDNLAKVLGKDLEGSLLPKVGQALKGLERGEVQKWDTLMSRLPDSMRQEIVVSSLNDIFKGANLQGKSLNPTQFTKFMDGLDRSPAIKNRLYKELPKESVKALENLRTVSKGVSIALQDKIPTGRIAAFFDDQDGLLRRLMGKGLMVAMSVKGGPIGAIAASEFINQSTNGAKSASAVLASPQFQNMVRTAVREGVTEGQAISDKVRKMEKAFEKSDKYKRWTNVLADDERAKLASVGTVAYLMSEETE